MNMDQTENQNFHTINKFQKHHFPRRTLQFSVSIISIFSLILFYSSGYVVFTNICNFYYSSVLFSFLNHTLERKYMFLLCNGILAFLVKSISFSPPSETFSDSHIDVEVNPSSATKLEYYKASMGLETVDTLQDHNVAPGVDEEIKEESEKEEKEEEEDGDGGGDDGEAEIEIVEEQNAEELSNEDVDEEQEEGEEEKEDDGDDDDEEEEMTSSLVKELIGSEVVSSREDSLSPEELNKKFEEFIRKTKEELRIEAQSQLIAV